MTVIVMVVARLTLFGVATCVDHTTQKVVRAAYQKPLVKRRAIRRRTISDVNKFNWKVHLTYFKGHGKYYSDGEYTSHKEQLFEIVAEARDIARAGKVSGMVDGYKPKFVLINAPNHPHDHPALYVQDMDEERDAALRNLRKLTIKTLDDITSRLDEEIVD